MGRLWERPATQRAPLWGVCVGCLCGVFVGKTWHPEGAFERPPRRKLRKHAAEAPEVVRRAVGQVAELLLA